MFKCLRLRGVLLGLALLLTLTSACSNNAGNSKLEGKLEGPLKVMYVHEGLFFQKYGNLFITKYPGVELEVVNSQWMFNYAGEDINKALQQYVEERQPDVILLNESNYSYAVDNGMLFPLDSVIQQDQFDLDSILPFVTESLKEQGAGILYGLAPTFSGSALYYNMDLFQMYNIELPRDRMSWQELFALAERFPTNGSGGERIYGLTSSTTSSNAIFDLLSNVARTHGLFYTSADGTSLTMDSEAWRTIYENIVKAYKSGAIFDPSSDFFSEDLFLKEQAAMVLEGSYYLNQIKQAEDQSGSTINWGLATIPVDPAEPDATIAMGLTEIFGINANSPNKKLAWEFIKYINGPEVAKTLSRTTDGSLSVRSSFVSEMNGRSLAAFYELTKPRNFNKRYEHLPQGFEDAFAEIVSQETTSILENKQTIDEAFQHIKDRGSQELQQAHEKGSITKKTSRKLKS